MCLAAVLVIDTLLQDSLVLCLFREWTDNFPYDFRDERMSKCLKDMTQLLVNIYPELRRDVSILMHNLFSKVCSLTHIKKKKLRALQNFSEVDALPNQKCRCCSE